ncbi:ABC transporter substrate-binding protein [Aureimonas phyllosphaerae]|uniref:Peptide/nickel transport system substrate-binding protein n=1 Tax=Aureimonas phyllosphaerae TaxID=1166078 RepID=A0A7W6BV11_9HYPH|nr:ABC transporter substrate-binding protein [Aureimonas phyllosphaerae]MBB3934241.1 peptide/nickel transport system substrate-binding protein [Aureimonas phyllosphaerae]MBB3958543.1 peptide/nickel transport system substrate-binding protein [Aureimonas phyllosphaerae]SFE98606.1 peptide/nickel transport system substrate-binding protein [Aureimonas phyllosphaerae]
MTPPVTILQRRSDLVDPHDCTDAADDLSILSAICETLVRRGDDGFKPGLAERWSVEPDARRWRFRIRDGASFHDGSRCDARAVAQSLHRMAREDKGYTLGAPAVWRQYLGQATIAGDGLDLSIDLAEPMADLLDVLVQGFIASPDCLPTMDAGDMAAVAGTGPYRVETVRDGSVRLQPAADASLPPLVFQAMPDAEARAAALREGQADVATNLPFAADLGAATTRVETLNPVAIIFLMNAARGPLRDVRLRRALSLALDRDALVRDVMDGGATPLHGFVSPVHFGAGHEAAPARDPAAARALLGQAGHGEGLTLTVSCPTRLPDEAVRLTAALGAQLAEIGVTLEVTYHEDREAYAHQVRRKEIGDLAVFDSSPLSTYRVLVEKLDARVEGSWWEGYHNAEVEDLIDRGRRSTDDAARAAIYRLAYRVLQDDPAWLTLYNPIRVTGLRGHHPGFALPKDAVLDVTRLPQVTHG